MAKKNKITIPCHQVQLSFYKPLLLSLCWSESLEIFIQWRKLATILFIIGLMILLTLLKTGKIEKYVLKARPNSNWMIQIDAKYSLS